MEFRVRDLNFDYIEIVNLEMFLVIINEDV